MNEALSAFFQCEFPTLPPLKDHPVSSYNTWLVFVVATYLKYIFEVLPLSSCPIVNLIYTGLLCVLAVLCVIVLLKRMNRDLLICLCLIVFVLTFCVKRLLSRSKIDEQHLVTLLDSVIQFSLTSVVSVVLSYSTQIFKDVYSKNIQKQAKEIVIEMDIMQLTDTAFPRLKNIYSWFKKKNIDVFQKDSGQYHIGKPHMLLIRTNYNKQSDLNLFSQEEATVIDKKQLTSSIGSCVEDYLNRFSYQRVPILLLCLIRIDKQGHIEKQDKRLLSYIARHCSKYKDIVVLYIVDSTTGYNTDLKKLSFEIQKKMDNDNITNDIFCRTFKVSERNLKEGIGLYLEQSLTRYILEVAGNNIKHETIEFTSALKIRNRLSQSNTLKHTLIDFWKEVVSEFQPCKPDSCQMHELEVLLERTKDVSAYGLDDDGLSVFVKTSHQEDDLKLYLDKYYHGKPTEIHIKVWDSTNKISKYNLKQGSKVARTDGKFGTLGLFLTDQKGITYFTTCSHVIEKHENAYNNSNSVIGTSVHAVNTGHDMAHDDLVDLSVIQADQSIVRHCQFGLRSTADEFIEGEIIGAQVIKSERMKSLKVYKWGAKSGLTRGTYKGWISRKDQNDRFDQNLHKIVCDNNQFFEEGDSGSLVCFEATGSPQFQNETGAYIFVGKLVSSQECQLAHHPQDNMYYCYHVSNVFDCTIGDSEIKPCLSPNSSVGRYTTGTSIKS